MKFLNVGKERRRAARQLRAAASAGRADPRRRAGPGRQSRHPRRSGQLGRRLSSPACRSAADVEHRPARRSAWCCSTPSPSSTAPTRGRDRALQSAEFVVSLTRLQDRRSSTPTCCCRSRPFTETAGTFVSTEGRVQSFHATVQPARRRAPGVEGAARARHHARPARLRHRHGGAGARRLPGRQGRREAACLTAITSRSKSTAEKTARHSARRRRADLFRRSAGAALAAAAEDDATRGRRSAWMNAKLMARLGVPPDGPVLIKQDGGQARLQARAGRQAARRLRAGRRRRIRRRRRSGAMFGARRRWRRAGLMLDSRCSPTAESQVRPDLGPGGLRDRGEPVRSSSPIVVPLFLLRRLPDAVGAQADRLDPDPHRAQPRRPARPAAADRRRHQAAVQGNHPPGQRQQGAVPARADG